MLTYFFILGTLIGSFLNVVILRYNTGKKFLKMGERSQCFSCGKTLRWYELVPVVSFVVLRGRCSSCKSRLSWQYPLVELATGAIFAGIFWQNFGPGGLSTIFFWQAIVLAVLQAVVWSLLMVIAVYDLHHKIIPDAFAYSFAVLALVLAIFFPQTAGGTGGTFLSSLLTGLGFFAFFAGLWFVSGGRWLGFGDAKLVLGVGFLLGAVRGLSALTIAFWIGAGVSLLLMAYVRLRAIWVTKAVRKGGLRQSTPAFTMKSEIPFAPFIILGTLISFFWQIDLFGIASLFQ